jgi:DNA-binding IclR family transcriptional regulator
MDSLIFGIKFIYQMKVNIEDKYRVPGLERGLRVIEILNERPGGMSMNELSAKLGIPANSVYRILATLERGNYVRKQTEGSLYELTSKLLTMSAPVTSTPSFVESSLPHMRALRDETKESVLCGTLIGHEGVVLEQVEGIHSFSFRIKPGLRFPLYTAAPGKLFLAHMAEPERKKCLASLNFEKFTPHTLTTQDALLKDLRGALDDGFAFDREEEMIGQVCIASGVFNRSGRIIGAIWMVAPTNRVPRKDLPVLGEVVRSHADSISLKFGYSQLRVA